MAKDAATTAMKFKVATSVADRERPALEQTKRLLNRDEYTGATLRVLGVPFGGHILERDAAGEAFHADTDLWMQPGDTRPVTYYHGFGPDDPQDWQPEPAVIGLATLVEMDPERGWWFEARLDEGEELAQRVMRTMENGGEVRASSGAVGHLVRYGEAGLIDVWPVGELALFDTNDWRRPANELAVVEMKATAGDEPEAEAALETGSVKSAAVLDEEPVLQEGGSPLSTNPNTLEGAQAPTEDEMNEEDLKALIEGVSAQLTAKMDAMIDERLPKEEAGKATAQIQVTTDEADQPWKSQGEFFQAVKTAALYKTQEDPRLRALKATGLSEGVPADGGYLVPQQTAAGIMERMYETGQILSRISVDPVTGNSMLYNGVDETTHVGSMYGGVVGYWLGEGSQIPASKPKFYQLELKLKKLAALCYATDEQLEDTANLDSWLNRTVPSVLRFVAEDAVVEGDGAGKPLGILNAPCTITPLREDASKVKIADIANMWARRWVGVSDYVWLVNQEVTAQLNAMTAATAPVYMPAGNIAGSPFGTIYGRPVIEVEYCPALGTTGDVILASLSQYQAINKGDVRADSSIHVAFLTDETAFRFVYRFAGAPAWQSALTPLHGSTVSPFVALSSASV